MSSTESLSAEHRRILISLARESINFRLQAHRPLAITLDDYPPLLGEIRASFVTLQKDGALRGCIGLLEATRPLVEDVAANACAAAFSDPRFPPVTHDELDKVDIHISVLGSPEKMEFSSQDDLISQLRPGIDGLILESDQRRGTFLPSVWESLTEPRDFVDNLKLKAGLPRNYWSDHVAIYRYTAEYFGEKDPA